MYSTLVKLRGAATVYNFGNNGIHIYIYYTYIYTQIYVYMENL